MTDYCSCGIQFNRIDEHFCAQTVRSQRSHFVMMFKDKQMFNLNTMGCNSIDQAAESGGRCPLFGIVCLICAVSNSRKHEANTSGKELTLTLCRALQEKASQVFASYQHTNSNVQPASCTMSIAAVDGLARPVLCRRDSSEQGSCPEKHSG